jgi:hypothetical protein
MTSALNGGEWSASRLGRALQYKLTPGGLRAGLNIEARGKYFASARDRTPAVQVCTNSFIAIRSYQITNVSFNTDLNHSCKNICAHQVTPQDVCIQKDLTEML